MYFDSNFNLINLFPDFLQKDFDMESYNHQFKLANVIIHATSKNVSYPPHWGPLSIKCAFKGKEFYGLNNCLYAVTDSRYLVINNGSSYSSYIDSDVEVNSFTINFSSFFVTELLQGLLETDDTLLADFGNYSNKNDIEIIEKLYAHDNTVSPLILKLLALTEDDFNKNILQIEELYFLLFERLLYKQKACINEINHVQAVKRSTQKELYKRLYRAKDFIDSCYADELGIQALANVCLLNQCYFLRQFKKYFKIAPHQYIIGRRMEEAKKMLEKEDDIPISTVCSKVGYSDPSSFSRLFKQYYRYSPKQYQYRHHTNNSLQQI